MGNRGILHDRDGVVGPKRFRHKNWIICRLHFRGRQRTINAPGRYTELFFADEATAMAAGHRPCAECQYPRWKLFVAAWRKAHNIATERCLSAQEIDRELHNARIDRQGRQLTYHARLGDLPDGVFVTLPVNPQQPFALWGGRLHPWTHEGYGAALDGRPEMMATSLTPVPLVRTLSAGYVPAIRCDLPSRRTQLEITFE
jgi:hypothetical protein